MNFIINDFLQHHSKYNSSYSPKKQIIPYNTSNLHDCLHDKKHFVLEEVFQIM